MVVDENGREVLLITQSGTAFLFAPLLDSDFPDLGVVSQILKKNARANRQSQLRICLESSGFPILSPPPS